MMRPTKRLESTSSRISRRRGLATATAATLTIVPRHVLGGTGQTPPSDKLHIAGVGIGGQGGWDLEQVNSENIVALCDVDWDYAGHTFKKYPQVAKYKDFRQMFDKEKGIDAVVVGTPDHVHAVVSMAAIKLGKHVYCEKPLTRTGSCSWGTTARCSSRAGAGTVRDCFRNSGCMTTSVRPRPCRVLSDTTGSGWRRAKRGPRRGPASIWPAP